MPINPNALGTPASDAVAPDGTELGQSGGAPAEEQPKRQRRSKAQLIADAVVPEPDHEVIVKDLASGAKVPRPWSEAVSLVKAGTAEFVDKSLKYAVLKMEQEQVAPAFEQPVAANLESGKRGDDNVPPEAEVGDEIVVGSETYRLGHGRVLTHGVIGNPDGSIIQAKRRWQRELGAGPTGPWESTPLSGGTEQTNAPVQTPDAFSQLAEAFQQPSAPDPTPVASALAGTPPGVTVQSETLPIDVERVGQVEWKIGTGILEKIGLPDYSQLQVGPISASRMVIDDGRRTVVTIGNGPSARQASIPTVLIETMKEVTDFCEFVARYQRAQLVSFLQATGAIKQPVTA